MKKIILPLVCMLTLNVAYSQVLSRKVLDVTDYFIKLPRCNFDKNRAGKDLLVSRGTLLTASSKRMVDVQKAKGFLNITDNTQDKFEVTLKLFQKSDMSTVVVFHEQYVGDTCDSYRTRAFVLDQKTGSLVEEAGVIPTVVFDAFLASPSRKQSYIVLDSSINYQYSILAEGSKLILVPVAAKNDYCLVYNASSKRMKLTPQAKADSIAAFRNMVKSRKFFSLDLAWKPDAGVFVSPVNPGN